MSEKNKSQAIVACKCPRCREGDMFTTPLFKKWYHSEMYEACSVCNQAFEPEPGFYFGAMFVSYAFSVAITFISGVILYNFFGDPSTWVYMSVVIVTVAIVWPLMFRYSRSIFLHLVGGIRYRPNTVL